MIECCLPRSNDGMDLDETLQGCSRALPSFQHPRPQQAGIRQSRGSAIGASLASSSVARRFSGTVRSWNPDGGFGFIVCAESRAIYNKDGLSAMFPLSSLYVVLVLAWHEFWTPRTYFCTSPKLDMSQISTSCEGGWMQHVEHSLHKCPCPNMNSTADQVGI